MRIFGFAVLVLGVLCSSAASGAVRAPNVVWITIDDCGPDFGGYGNTLVRTPNLDRLAASGARFTRAFATTPVCSPSRSALITGVMPGLIGQQHHRSRRPLPVGVETLPALLRAAGYRSTALPSRRVPVWDFLERRRVDAAGFDTVTGRLKEDFNFNRGGASAVFEDWDPAQADVPFFALIDFNPQKGPAPAARTHADLAGARIDPADVPLRPYWPDTPAMRDRTAHYLEALHLLDAEIGRVLEWLESTGLREHTYVVVWADHGAAFFRHKQWCYDSGLHVPLIVSGPGIAPQVRDDLVSALDLAPTTLVWCGVPPHPAHSGRDLFDGAAPAPEFIFGHRDRCDETEDRVRTVRSARYRLIHNQRPDLPWIGRNAYTRGAFPEVPVLLELRADGALTPIQTRWTAATKPEWELYDLERDPYELHDLADDPEHADIRARLERALAEARSTLDGTGPYPEAAETMVPNTVRAELSARRDRSGAVGLPEARVLFDGVTLDGWRITGGGAWTVEDGVIVGRSRRDEPDHGLLVCDETFGDMIVSFEYRVVQGNSGFYFHAQPSAGGVGVVRSYQVEVDDAKPGGLYETGGKGWVVRPADAGPHRRGAWNTVELRARAPRFETYLNGVRVADLFDAEARTSGKIALQLHGGQDMHVEYRAITVRAFR